MEWLRYPRIYISTHTPHARRDVMFKFLLAYTDISTHTPHARRDSFVSFHFEKLRISTHTPHARRDNSSVYHIPVQYRFLLTRLMRGVTLVICVLTSMLIISTHTPHARRDHVMLDYAQYVNDFYSHASCEA